jgi:UDP-glucose 4-epimerase
MDKRKKMLITGSSGFIGSHVADILEEQGFSVVLFDAAPSKYKSKAQEEFIGDILTPGDIDKVMEGCNAVYHFAAQADIEASRDIPTETITANIIRNPKCIGSCQKV